MNHPIIKPLFILSPCGTSLLTNTAKDKDKDKKVIFEYSNATRRDDVPAGHQKILDNIITRARKGLMDAEPHKASKMSAELNGILSIYHQRLPTSPARDHHLLLCTDTWLGEETGRLVEQWLTKHEFTARLKKQQDLQTADLPSFQLALSDMVSWMDREIREWRASHRVIFNLTGGFKSVQGFLQTLAMFYADEAVYIFETGNTLLRIPRLPVEMTAPEVLKTHLEFFRQLALGLVNRRPPPADIPESMLLNVDDEWSLSPWGELIWEQNRNELYSVEVYPPPCDFVRTGAHFMDSVKTLPPDRRRRINEKIDDLCRFWLSRGKGRSNNPLSLDFKELKGNPSPPSTHECDAWAEHGGKRIFMHIEPGINGEKILILDRLGDHLK